MKLLTTFHEHDKNILLKEFRKETFDSIDRQISLNPILHSFQRTVHDYAIDRQLIGDFFYQYGKRSFANSIIQKKNTGNTFTVQQKWWA
ncbi:MAG: hypothetical protein WDN26_21160 [Chitinophagaceae bacterium]